MFCWLEEFLQKLSYGVKIEEENDAPQSGGKKSLEVEAMRIGMSAKKCCFWWEG